MASVIVIAGGYSLKGRDTFDLRKRGLVIGVNDAALYCRCDYGISMDRLWVENRYERILMEQRELIAIWVRRETTKNIKNLPPRVSKFECNFATSEMADEIGRLNGSNSGVCGINLAMQHRPDRIYLLGFDMMKGPKGEPYWYPPYHWAKTTGGTAPKTYQTWAQEFAHIAEQAAARNIAIFNVTNRSAVTQFPRYSWEKFMDKTEASRKQAETRCKNNSR